MSGEIRFAVSAQPVETIVDSSGSRNLYAIDNAVNRSIGGSGSDGYNAIVGFTSGTPSYIDDAAIVCSDETLVLKHTGKDTSGDVITDAVNVRVTNVSGEIIATLNTGEAIVLPRCSTTIYVQSGTVRVEYIQGDIA